MRVGLNVLDRRGSNLYSNSDMIGNGNSFVKLKIAYTM
jgi:hypothetical protein